MERNDIIDVTPVDQSHEQAKAQNDPARKQPAGPANRTGKALLYVRRHLLAR